MHTFINEIYEKHLANRIKNTNNYNTFLSKSEFERMSFDLLISVIDELKIHSWNMDVPSAELLNSILDTIEQKNKIMLRPINHEVLLKRIVANKTLYVDLTNNSGLVEELLLPNFKYALITDFDEDGFKFSIDSEDEYRDYNTLINCTFVDRDPCGLERVDE